MQYDPFQLQAMAAVEKNHSVLVCAPTGAGKTVIAEHVIQQCLDRNIEVIYTAPIKALSNQKFRDFSRRYPDRIGILTGDVSLNAQAPVLIMTTEIFRNTLLENPHRFRNAGWVIFDEVHYLDDNERGTVWEESIIFCPEQMRMLCLSATVPNAHQLAEWIRSFHTHPLDVISESQRPVPLAHRFQAENFIHNSLTALRKNVYQHLPGRRSQQRHHAKSNRIDSLLHHLQEANQLPGIYFAFSRKRCELLAQELFRFNLLSPEERQTLVTMFDGLLKKYNLEAEPSAMKMRPLVEHGIAYHHAGLLPSLKEVVEQLFTSRLIKLIFTTETFALGINMPAKTVIFDELRKFYGFAFANLRCRDYYQMAGRAGRRGIDPEGFVYSRINPQYIPWHEVNRIVQGQQEPVISQFNLSYASLLHLYRRWQDTLYEIYPQTLHHFQSGKRGRKNALSLLRTKISLLREMGYITDQGLTMKGECAAQLYGYELPLSELLAAGILDHLTPGELSCVLAALVFEPRKDQEHVKPAPGIAPLQKLIAPVVEAIHRNERRYRIYPLSKKPYFNLAPAIQHWSEGSEFGVITGLCQTDEGEIVRYFRMVIQILRQMRPIPSLSPSFRQTIDAALTRINRGEVDAEKQLREGM